MMFLPTASVCMSESHMQFRAAACTPSQDIWRFRTTTPSKSTIVDCGSIDHENHTIAASVCAYGTYCAEMMLGTGICQQICQRRRHRLIGHQRAREHTGTMDRLRVAHPAAAEICTLRVRRTSQWAPKAPKHFRLSLGAHRATVIHARQRAAPRCQHVSSRGAANEKYPRQRCLALLVGHWPRPACAGTRQIHKII